MVDHVYAKFGGPSCVAFEISCVVFDAYIYYNQMGVLRVLPPDPIAVITPSR